MGLCPPHFTKHHFQLSLKQFLNESLANCYRGSVMWLWPIFSAWICTIMQTWNIIRMITWSYFKDPKARTCDPCPVTKLLFSSMCSLLTHSAEDLVQVLSWLEVILIDDWKFGEGAPLVEEFAVNDAMVARKYKVGWQTFKNFHG